MKTIEELSGMSDEELRVMCGRAHGYTLVRESDVPHPENGTLLTRLLRPDGEVELQFWWGEDLDAAWKPSWRYMPNYPADLNVMHEAESCLRDGELDAFEEAIKFQKAMGARVCDFSEYASDRIWNTRARQRCIAFIATKQTEHIHPTLQK